MQKIVEVCTRVEGHGDVKILMEKDEISSVEFELSGYRGFESFLIGKKISDVPRIASRICGLCHASQNIVSCKTIEDIFNIKSNQQANLIRRLLMTGELIKSHSAHFFFQAFPDLLEIFKITDGTLDPYDLISFNPELTSKMYELIKFGNDIDKIFGGRGVHILTNVPGGTIYKASKKNISLAQKYFQKATENLEWIIELFINTFSELTPPADFRLPKVSCLALNEARKFDRYKGSLSIKSNSNKICDIPLEEHSSYFDKDSNAKIRGIMTNKKTLNNILVGPMARNKIVEKYNYEKIEEYFSSFSEDWKENLLYLNALRLFEMCLESYQAIDILDQPMLNAFIPLPSLSKAVKSHGIGIIEAPRGTLMHQYKVGKKMVLEEVKLFIATEFNMPVVNEMITSYARRIYEKEDLDSVKKEVQKIIRAFDPCIACATH